MKKDFWTFENRFVTSVFLLSTKVLLHKGLPLSALETILTSASAFSSSSTLLKVFALNNQKFSYCFS